MSPNEFHPTDSELSALLAGDLPSERMEELSIHFEACSECRQRIEATEDQDTASISFLSNLRALPQDAEELPKNLLARGLKALTDAGSFTHEHHSETICEGTRFGRFVLKHELGQGSFGRVFCAHDVELERDVAIKIQWRKYVGETEKEPFFREAKTAARLEHPNIVSLYEASCTTDGLCFLVTELVEGVTLEEELRRRQPSVREAAELVRTLAKALHYAHEQGVIHRDIKPSNVMLDATRQPHLMDFGLAKLQESETTATPDGEILGTPAYMSPEQARGESGSVDRRSDVYALGVILYELLTKERPFNGNRRMLLLQVLEDEPKPPRQLLESIPKDLETICLKAMSKARGRRFETAKTLMMDLDRWLTGKPILARSAGPMERLYLWSKRNPWAASFLLAVTIGPLAGLVYLNRLSQTFAHSMVAEDARIKLEILEEFNDVYSEIVDHVGPNSKNESASFPLPAQLTIELCQRLTQRDIAGVEFRLYSDYPFPWRKDGGPRDEFEKQALEQLRKNSSEPVISIAERKGESVLRYARARVMKPSCISCHNNHPESPKTDWAVGDVRGALQIVRPLNRDESRVQDNLWGAFGFVLKTSGTILLVIMAGILLGKALRR